MTQLHTAFQGIALTAFAVAANVAFPWQCHRSLPIFPPYVSNTNFPLKDTNFHPTTVSFEVACILKKNQVALKY